MALRRVRSKRLSILVGPGHICRGMLTVETEVTRVNDRHCAVLDRERVQTRQLACQKEEEKAERFVSISHSTKKDGSCLVFDNLGWFEEFESGLLQVDEASHARSPSFPPNHYPRSTPQPILYHSQSTTSP